MRIIHLDYEGRSGVDINDVGSHRFSIDPLFEILCAAVSEEGSDEVFLWVNPLFRTPDMMGDNVQAEKLLAEADLIYAHNAQNEQANTWGALTQGKACPFKTEPPITIWRCTAAMARKAGLPGSLEDVGEAINIRAKKDRRGSSLIKLFCVIDEKTGTFTDPRSRPDEWIAFGDYCRQDVRAEKEVGQKLKAFALTGAALEAFQFDLRMNQRGIPINVSGARNAQKLIESEQNGVRTEFRQILGINPTQRAKFIVWMKTNTGLELPNTQAETIEAEVDKLEDQLKEWSEPSAKSALERQLEILRLYQKVSYAAVAKITKMLECVCPDGRVRGGHMYYGAGTGRWSGKLLQPQNFKKTPVELKSITDEVYQMICAGGSRFVIDQLYGDPLEMLSICIRHFIHADVEMLDGDFNAVEARIICWLADETGALDEYRRGIDRYQGMAADIYDKPLEYIKSLGKDSTERTVGKHTVLGCGFGMGRPEKFIDTCWKQGGVVIEEDLATKCIKAYRKKHKKVVSYWWQLDRQCKDAVRNPGAEFGPFSMRKIAGIPFLLFRLRSGRALAYPHPKLELFPFRPKKDDLDAVDEFGNPIEKEIVLRENVTYWGEIKKGVWGRVKLYGGKLAENEAQATAADFMAHGALRAERMGMEPFMLVHDQGLALRTNGQTPEMFEHALGGDLPEWAAGFPMKVEAKITPYYKK